MPLQSQLPEHLKAYWKQWCEFRNEKNSIEQDYDAYKALRSLLTSQPLSVPSVAAAQPKLLAATISSSSRQKIAESASELTQWHIGIALGQHGISRNIEYYYGERAPPTQLSNPSSRQAESSGLGFKKRKGRCCPRCQKSKEECRGAWLSQECGPPTVCLSTCSIFGCTLIIGLFNRKNDVPIECRENPLINQSLIPA